MGEDSLDGYIHSWDIEGLKKDLSHLLPVGFWVEWSLSAEGWVFLWSNTELIVECVMPDLFHVIPVCDDTVLNWIFQGEDTSLALGFISNIGVLLAHTYHHTLMTGTSDNGGKDGTGCIIPSKASFAHTGSIVHNKSGNIVVTHFVELKYYHSLF